MTVDERYRELYPDLDGSPFAGVEAAVEDIRAGRMVVVVDSPERENEGDLVMAAECVTPEAINFMARHARGLICLSLTPERCDELGLPMMTHDNRTPFETAFTVSIEARTGVSTTTTMRPDRISSTAASTPAKGDSSIS
jgi:3,4-dihydroxy 2-butanone 4-phosphate synthase/GTP cyclohydrolase II